MALVLLPFITHATEAIRAVGWLAALCVVAGNWHREWIRPNWAVVGGAGATAALLGAVWYRGTLYHWGSVALAVVGLVLVSLHKPRRARPLLWIASFVSVAALAWSVTHDPGGYLDVALMHREGANALRAGLSPWSGLTVPNGAPGAEGTIITGDPYPPMTLMWYSVLDWITGDPRGGGALAWVILALLAPLGRYRDQRPIVLLLTSGALPLMLWTGWTEILMMALLVGVVVTWQRPVVSSIFLGLTLASKQYMVVAAPLLVLGPRGNLPKIRRLLPVIVAGLIVLVGFALGEGYLDAIVGAYGDFEARTDSASLVGAVTLAGFEMSIPVWVGPLAGAAWALIAAVRGRVNSLSTLLVTFAESLTVLFLLGTQAFANYWFLVWGLLLAAVSVNDPAVDQERDLAVPRKG